MKTNLNGGGMKTMALAAVLTAMAAGSAFARGEGGCIPPRPPKKSQAAVSGKATPRPLVTKPAPPPKPECGCGCCK